jgi:hypothetical protein
VKKQGIRLGSLRLEAELGPLVFASLLYGICLAYYLDARSVSLHLQNLLLLTPLFIGISVIYVGILIQSVRIHRIKSDLAPAEPAMAPAPTMASADVSPVSPALEAGERAEPSQDSKQSRAETIRSVGLIVLFAGYIIALPYAGFDVGSMLFVLLTLLWLGERRVGRMLVFSVVFPFLVTLAFKNLLPYPMPTLLFG